MHIVFLSNEYPLWSPGGIGSFLQTFGRSLVKNNHTVSIVGIGTKITEEIIEDKGVQLYRLPRKKGFLPDFIYNSLAINRKLKSLHKERLIDIIEASELGFAFISKKHPAKRVIRLHGGHHFFSEAEKRGINWKKGWMEKTSFSKADGFIAVSKYVKDHTQKYLSYHGKTINVINHPLDTSFDITQGASSQNHILFAGTVCEKKGVRQLLEAFKIVSLQHPEMHLDIFGRDWFFPDGSSYMEKLKETYKADFFKNVIFHGSIAREELYLEYANALFCVFPSHMETQGLVVLEAMLLGKPVIFTEYGPGPETIKHNETGLLCDVYDPKDIAEKMEWIIENKEKANTMGENARQLIKKKYDLNIIVHQNIEFYKSIIHNQ